MTSGTLSTILEAAAQCQEVQLHRPPCPTGLPWRFLALPLADAQEFACVQVSPWHLNVSLLRSCCCSPCAVVAGGCFQAAPFTLGCQTV